MQHTGMLWLPSALEAAGVDVWVLDGWDTAQGSYRWTDPDTELGSYSGVPSVFMVHHTAGTAATPVVPTSSGQWSKANCWIGLRRGDRLYQSGGGVPTVAVTSSGPARISSGYGVRATFDQVRSGTRFQGPQRAADDYPLWAANRFAWNAEVVHPGDGSPLDAGVRDAVVKLGAVLCERFGWSPWQVYGHLDHTKRKIDPYWDGDRYAIASVQDDVAALIAAPPIEPPAEDFMYIPVEYTDGFNSNPAKRAAVAGFQGALKIKGFADGNSQSADGVDGKYGNGTIAACKAFQKSVGFKVTGMGDIKTRAKAEE